MRYLSSLLLLTFCMFANAQNLSVIPAVNGISVVALNHLIPGKLNGAFGSQLIFNIEAPATAEQVYSFYKEKLKNWDFCGLEDEEVYLWFSEEKQMSAFVFTTTNEQDSLKGEFSSYVYKNEKHYAKEKNIACNRPFFDIGAR